MPIDIERLAELPAMGIAKKLNETLDENGCVVVTAPPGAGKSTVLPLTIRERKGNEGKVIMLEPRRIAARQVAERLAENMGERTGETVGYRIRFESRTSEKTAIEVVTEGILTKMLTSDPTLEGVGTIIFDEFHERSINADVALAMAREVQQTIRPDLRIVIMSATIETEEICRELQAPLIECEGRRHEVRIVHTEECDAETVVEVVSEVVQRAHGENDGDMLVFLPGEAEIRRVEENLRGRMGATRVLPLYGMMSIGEQRRAILPSKSGERKIVLATPIAETSLTIEGVRVVVDSGLCRQMVYDQRSSTNRLETTRISMDMATQRTGRAGRTADGVCYRLWSTATEQRMKETRVPEILTADFAPTMLDLAVWGTRDAEKMMWITKPTKSSIEDAKELLLSLGAIDEEGKISAHGRRLSDVPCHPRMAQMIVKARTEEERALATDIAALIEERDPMAKSESSADINIRIDELRRGRRNGTLNKKMMRIERVAEQYRRIAKTSENNDEHEVETTGALIASAYPERVASAVQGRRGLYMLSNGNMATVDREDELCVEDWIAVANVNMRGDRNGKIFLASKVEPSDLRDLLRERERIEWDAKQGCVVAQKEYKIGRLTLGTRPVQVSREQIVETICKAARLDGERMLDFGGAEQLQRRVECVRAWHPEMGVEDIGTEEALRRVDEWLPLYIGNASTTAELRKIDMSEALMSLLSYEHRQAVERLAPTHIVVPTGSKIKVEYRSAELPPVVRVRLQEMFGQMDTPRVDEGRREVLLELLSPGYKAVQTTQDLRSFWKEGYFEVRKELRRRYPKHYWPDEPESAEAVRGVRRETR